MVKYPLWVRVARVRFPAKPFFKGKGIIRENCKGRNSKGNKSGKKKERERGIYREKKTGNKEIKEE